MFGAIEDPDAVRYIGGALAIGLGAIGPGLGIGLAVRGAMDAKKLIPAGLPGTLWSVAPTLVAALVLGWPRLPAKR